ncbi:MAG TPA: hypothetical protein VFA09_17135 [Ktedonobacteraceae bacterium]|nr:hypothetical protein [Ktedonobacteraceae bacterium]
MLIIIYLFVTTIFSIIFVWQIVHRIAHPFECTCGFRTRFLNKFKGHLLQSHRWH